MPTISPDQIAAAFSASGESPAPSTAVVPGGNLASSTPAPQASPSTPTTSPDDVAGSFATSGAKPAPSRQAGALGGAIADMSASFQPKRGNYSGYCERLTADTVKQATGSDIVGGVNLRQNAIDVLHDAKAKGIGFAYQPGMQLQPGDIALSGRMGNGYGHSMIVGDDGVVRSDLAPGVGQNKIDWVIRPDWAHGGYSSGGSADVNPDAIAAAFGTRSGQSASSSSQASAVPSGEVAVSPSSFLKSVGEPTTTSDFLRQDMMQKYGGVPQPSDLISNGVTMAQRVGGSPLPDINATAKMLYNLGHPADSAHYQFEHMSDKGSPVPGLTKDGQPTVSTLIKQGAKLKPINGLPGFWRATMPDHSTVFVSPADKDGSVRLYGSMYAAGYDKAFPQRAPMPEAVPVNVPGLGTRMISTVMPNGVPIENANAFDLAASFIPSGQRAIGEFGANVARRAGLSPQVQEDVGQASTVIPMIATGLPGIALQAGTSALAGATHGADAKQAVIAATSSLGDTLSGIVSSILPGGEHSFNALMGVLTQPDTDPHTVSELKAAWNDIKSHPISSIVQTVMLKGAGHDSLYNARDMVLSNIHDAIIQQARGAELAGNVDLAHQLEFKAGQIESTRQQLAQLHAEYQRKGSPQGWLNDIRNIPAAAGPALSRAASIADAFSETSPRAAMARGRELVQADQNAPSFLGMSQGTPAEAITRPADYAQRIAQAFQEAEPTPQTEESASQVTEPAPQVTAAASRATGPTPQVSDHEGAETVAPEWERPAVNEWQSSAGDRIRVDMDGYHLYPRGSDRPSGTFDTLHEAQAAAPPVTVKNEADNVTTSEPNVTGSEPNVRSLEPNVTSSPAAEDEERTALERIASRRAQPPAEETMPAKEAEVPIPDYTRDHGIVPNFPVDELHVDPDRFQYKIGYGANGVASSSDLGEARKFNSQLAGLVDVWKDPEDGKVYVVNGHNRRALAKRTGESTMNVQFIDADTAAEARFVGAMKNIAEGQGTAFDAAKLFRDTQLTPEDLQEYGISLKGQVAKHGLALANLSPQLFGSALRNEIPLERAVLIGSKLKDHADQAALVNLIDKRSKSKSLTNDQISEIIDSVQNAPRHTSTTDSLFGADETTQNLAVERAGVAAHIRTTLAKDANALGAAARNADRITSVEGNAIEAGKTKAVADENKDAVEVFDRLKNSSGPVSDILNKAAARIAAGEKATHVYSDALKQYRAEAKEYTGRRGAEGSGAEHRAGSGVQPTREGADGERQTAEEPGGSLFAEPSSGKSGGTGGKLKSIAQRAENDAQARIDARKAKGGPRLKNTTNSGLGGAAQEYIDHATDYAIVGAAKILRGAVDRAEWARQMVADFGDGIRPFLDHIYNLAHERIKQLAKQSAPPADTQTEVKTEASVNPTGASVVDGRPIGPERPADAQPVGPEHPAGAPSGAQQPSKSAARQAKYAASINVEKLSSDELKDAYEKRAKDLGLDKQEPLGRDEVVQQARTLGLTYRGLVKLPVGWKPNTVHLAVWFQAVRDADDAAHTAESTAKRNYAARPTAGNKAAVDRAKAIADETFKRRSALAREWGQTGHLLQTNSDPFVAAREGDIFRQITRSTNFKEPRSIADRVNSPNFGKAASRYTSAETDAALSRLQTRFQRINNDLGDCKA